MANPVQLIYEKGTLHDLNIADLQTLLSWISFMTGSICVIVQLLSKDQKVSLNLTILKMRSMLLEKTHKLKVPVAVTA
jgi:hypothetical protein